ncbi:8-oxoguanine glycosylase OGG1 [Rhodotorula paludigena]|uniref:8-oxoguanine glycosylase OGG1 n=1 Tax=Rhodotorula paludigena TaxID=86838 RepID=UPI00316C27FB
MACLATPLRFLPLSRAELQLASCLPSGQSFRWHRLAPAAATLPDTPSSPAATAKPATAPPEEEWAFGWQDRTVVLRQEDDGLYYRSLYPYKSPHAAYAADLASNTTLPLLRSYFQLDTPLVPLYSDWSERDDKFKRKMARKGQRLEGIRVLKQDEWETLVSFICSANNNISRITLMVNRLCASLGTALPHPSSFTPSSVHHAASTIPSSPPPAPPSVDPSTASAPSLFSFPPPDALTATTTESLLRALGFGYRASFLPASAAHLLSRAREADQTPHEYLRALGRADFVAQGRGGIADAREKLLEFKGVGRKVADCVLLFGLGWTETVPVDTHVFQIAIRDYAFPASRTTSLTPQLHDRVSSFLATKWGAHAGWAQQVLFFADLKTAAATKTARSKSAAGAGGGVFERLEVELEEEEGEVGAEEKKLSFDEEVAVLLANPGTKRKRTTVLQAAVQTGGAGVLAVKEEEEVELVEEDEKKPAKAKRPSLGGMKGSTKGGRRTSSRGGAVKMEE